MPAQEFLFDAAARRKILAGITRLARAVKTTLGPGGRNVVIERRHRAPTLTKDGVTVATEIELADRFENTGVQLVKQAASATAREVGDGTTTVIVLAEAIFRHGLRHVTAGSNPIFLKRGIEKAVTAAIRDLARQARPVTNRAALLQIATVSANGDLAVGTLVTDAMERVGPDGAVTVEAGRGMVSELIVTDGMQLDRGYLSGYFATSAATMEAVLEDACILIHEPPLQRLDELLPLLRAVAQTGRPLLIIAGDVGPEALRTLVANRLRGTLRVCAVQAPAYGEERRDRLIDLAIMCGGGLFSTETGGRPADITLAALGRARHVTVGRHTTLIRQGGGAPAALQSRARELRHRIETSSGDPESASLRQRLARLVGGVAVLRIGAATELELHETMGRVEDAHQAARAAAAEGVVAGGGVALLRSRAAVDGLDLRGEEAAGADSVSRALDAPLRVLCENAGIEPGVIVQRVAGGTGGFGYNVTTGRFEDLLETGIVDPVKVTRLALQNAASIAGLLLTTECMLAEIPTGGPGAAG